MGSSWMRFVCVGIVSAGIALVSAFPRSALAVEGAIEINAARAAVGDVTGTGADAPGFPVTIDVAGTFLLTSGLTVPAGDGIEVLADDVVIDLNGFVITGPAVCTGSPGAISCPAGSDVGINGTGVPVHLRNGTVTGFAGGGVRVGSESRVENIKAFLNGGSGIEVGDRSMARDNLAVRNGGSGIVAGSDSIVSWNATSGNTLLGLVLGAGTGFSQNVANENGGGGFAGGLAFGANACEEELNCSETVEVCDSADNDGDALIDEDFPNLGNACGSAIGVCVPGFIVCTIDELGTECSGVEPSTELCNGLDDNCDGQVDETFNLNTDTQNCGDCGNQCAIMESCVAGACL